MSTPAQVTSAIITQLKNSSDLSYVNDLAILNGARDDINVYPTILLEPTYDEEEDTDTNTKVTLRSGFVLMAYNRVSEVSKQIVGDVNSKGIKDILNDIKKALSSDRTLGGVAIDVRIGRAEYDFNEFPTRMVALGIEVIFRQTESTRT